MDLELEFISSDMLGEKISDDRVKYILQRVKKNKILVVEETLSAREEAQLIEATMNQINDQFTGIEISTLKDKTEGGLKQRLIKLLGGSTGGLTVIGPSKLIKRIKQEPQQITMLAGEKK